MARTIRRDTRERLQERGKLREMRFEYDPAVGRLVCWPKGIRSKVVVPLGAVWQRGMKQEADQKRSLRKRRKR